MATNEELSGLAGGVSGFAEGLLGTMKANADREAAADKFSAYVQLQQELAGNKFMDGKELADLALSLGVSENTIKANLNPGQKYPTSSIGPLLNNLRAKSDTELKEAGANKRAKDKAAQAPKEGKPNVFDPAKAETAILANIPGWAGFKKGTPIKSLFKTQAEAQAAIDQIKQAGQAALKGYGREADFEVTDPFVMSQEPSWWNSAQFQPQSLFRARQAAKAAAAPSAAPIGAALPGAVPPKPKSLDDF